MITDPTNDSVSGADPTRTPKADSHVEAAKDTAVRPGLSIKPVHLQHRRFLRAVLHNASRSPARAVAGLFVFVLCAAAIVGTLEGPLPAAYHDEFGYLLQADTFTRGRMANPTHPMAQHFETFHVIQKPTYASKYQPAQGAVLAVGQVLTGEPAAGAWLAAAVMCAATLWMLLAWVPPRWAVLGGILIAFHFGISGYWAQSYWGGAVPATGGALVFGAVRRIWHAPRARWAVLLGLGVVILAASRPYEGLVVCALAATPLLVGWWNAARRRWLRQVAVPAGVVIVAGGAVLTSYNQAVTGSRWTLPYSVYMDTYALAPNFLFQEPRSTPISYSSERLQRFQAGFELKTYESQQTLSGFVSGLREKGAKIANTFAWGPPYVPSFLRWPTLIWIPLLFVPFAWMRRPWIWLATAAIAVLILAEVPVTYSSGHYVSPVVPLVFVLITHGLRTGVVGLRSLRRRSHTWILVLFGWVGVSLGAGIMIHRHLNTAEDLWTNQRRDVLERLQSIPGDHVVFVEYDPEYSIHSEWVYNSAEIDGQRVVWARDLGEPENRALRDYYADRIAWHLFLAPDEPPALDRIRLGD